MNPELAVRIIPPESMTDTTLLSASVPESETWNRLLFENDLTNAVWARTNSTVTPDTIVGPLDGKMSADTLTANAANGQIAQSYTALAASYTMGVYLRRRTGSGAVSISLDGTTFVTVAVTGVWTQFTTTATLTAGTKSATIRLATSGDAVDVWGVVVVTNFALGDRVERIPVHAVYQRKVAGNTVTMPEFDAVNWTLVGPNNRWAMFDTSSSTRTTSSTTISYRFRPGRRLSSIAAFNVTGSSVRFRVINAAGVTTYDQTRGLGTISEPSWYAWFFEQANQYDQFVALDVTIEATDEVLLDVTPVSGVAAVGTFVYGRDRRFGYGAELGAQFGIRDYSIKAQDEFGQTLFVERAFSRRARFQMHVDRAQADQLFAMLVSRRAKPTLYILTSVYESGFVFGYFNDFQQLVAFPDLNIFEMELESLA